MTPFFSQRLDKHNPGVSTRDISLYSYHNQGFVSCAAKWVITGTIKLDFCWWWLFSSRFHLKSQYLPRNPSEKLAGLFRVL